MKFTYQVVDRIPKPLHSGVIYHDKEFELAALLCPCGCGHEITLLVPDGHQIFLDKGCVTVHPSIAVCDAPCKSHYFIRSGRIEWLPAFSQAQASAVMRNQIARHALSNRPSPSWFARCWSVFVRALDWLRSLIGF